MATDAVPRQILALFRGAIPTGIQFGTVTVRTGRHVVEVTTLRTETDYYDRRRPSSVSFGTDIREDLSRRDFTVNAMALDTQSGELLDPFGAQRDIRYGILRAIGSAEERVAEDALRILRALRFATTHNYIIEAATWEAIQHSISSLEHVAAERIRSEIEKILHSERMPKGFVLLKNSGALKWVVPELEATVGYPQRKHDARTLYGHVVMVASRLPGDRLDLRLAGLLHDVAKPLCRAQDATGKTSYYGHERLSSEMCGEILRRLRFSNAVVTRVTHLVRYHMEFIQSYWSDAAVRRMIVRVGQENLEDIIALQYADCNNRRYFLYAQERIKTILSASHTFRIRDLAINGSDLMALGVPEGPVIGTLLSQLHETVLDDPRQNRKEILTKIALELYRQRIQL